LELKKSTVIRTSFKEIHVSQHLVTLATIAGISSKQAVRDEVLPLREEAAEVGMACPGMAGFASEVDLHRCRGFALRQLKRYDEARTVLEDSRQRCKSLRGPYGRVYTDYILAMVDIEQDKSLDLAARRLKAMKSTFVRFDAISPEIAMIDYQLWKI